MIQSFLSFDAMDRTLQREAVEQHFTVVLFNSPQFEILEKIDQCWTWLCLASERVKGSNKKMNKTLKKGNKLQ